VFFAVNKLSRKTASTAERARIANIRVGEKEEVLRASSCSSVNKPFPGNSINRRAREDREHRSGQARRTSRVFVFFAVNKLSRKQHQPPSAQRSRTLK